VNEKVEKVEMEIEMEVEMKVEKDASILPVGSRKAGDRVLGV